MLAQSGRPDADNPLLQAGLITELETFAARLIRLRWLAGGLLIAATAVGLSITELSLPGGGLFILGGVILLSNGLLIFRLRRLRTSPVEITERTLQRFVQFQIALDWGFLTVFLHLTGGICSPAIPILLIHVAMAAMLLPGTSLLLFLTAGIGLLAGIALLEWAGILPHYHIMPVAADHLYERPLFIVAQLAFLTLTAAAVVYLVSRSVRQLRRREQQIAGLLESSRVISSTLNLADVLDRLTFSAAQMLDKPGASIRLLNENSDELVMLASYGLSQTYLEKGPVKPARSPLDRESLLGTPIIIAETQDDPRIQYPQQMVSEGIRSLLVVPLQGRERILGVLRVYEAIPNGFTADDASLATAIAQQGAVAIENALVHDELHRLETERTGYLRVVTHELRAPVAGAQSLIRTLLRGAAGAIDETQTDILQRVERRLDMLITLVEDMLALAASKTPPDDEEISAVALEAVLRGEIDRFAQEAEAEGITLTSLIPTQDTHIMATADGLARIFGNLIGNAIKYTPAGGTVQVKLERHETFVNIDVCDDGIGIPEDDLPRIWDEFFRSSKVRGTEIAGTGLGLAIVRELVTRFKGMISVDSTEGVGTTFSVTFPLTEPPVTDSSLIG